MKIRTLIVDDEPLARERLTELLRTEPELELIGECSDGATAVAQIRQLAPDLVFLDVQMPELDGFGVLGQLEEGRRPAVVFVTAYDQYALKAFEVHAGDYLLKPFDQERCQTALQRALQRLRGKDSADLTRRLSALLADLKPEARPADRIAVKGEGRVVLVKLDDLDWVEAADNYVVLHTGQESHLLRETLTNLEARLPAAKFLRISRSAIVNLERIKELQPLFHGEYVVVLRNGAKVTLSRGYRDKLPQLGLA